jgi:hypothetical protein
MKTATTREAAGNDRRLSASWKILVTIGVAAFLMGLWFILLRPSVVLLPEDSRFTGLTPEQFQALSPKLFEWAGFVFRSWGAFAIGLGVLIVGVAMNAYRHAERWAWLTLAIAGLLTFSIFFLVNMVLGSDFRLIIAGLLIVYAFALWLPWRRFLS